MHIIKRELRANFKSLLIWSAVMILIILMAMAEFSAYYDNPEMADILDAMPKAMLEAFSMANANLTTVSGFVSLFSFYFYIMLGLFAVLLGNGIISKEERDKTAEFFLTLPVSREQVIFSKWIAAIIHCILINAVTGSTIYVTTYKYSPDNEFYKFLGLMLLALFILQMIFLSVGMFLAAFLKRYKSSGKLSASILFVTYIMSIMVGLSDKMEFLKYLSPFRYFEANNILHEMKFELVYVILSLCIITVFMVGTFIIYPKRDLHL